MNPVPDRKKLRREYLNRRVMYHGMAASAWIWVLMATLFGVMSLVIAAVGLAYRSWPSLWPLFVQSFGGFIGALVIVGIAMRGRKKMLAILQTTDYVPPVTPSTLPAEEILVRGTTEPFGPSETLLRASVKGKEANAEAMLRVVAGARGEKD